MASVFQMSAEHFNIQYVLESTQNLLTVVAGYNMVEYGDPSKLYVVKILFDNQPSIERDRFENERQTLSKLPSHPNIVQLESSFISTMPESFIECLPENVQLKFNEEEELKLERKQFLVYHYHPQQLSNWLSENPLPLCLETALKLAEEILTIFKHLEKYQICYLNIQLSDFGKQDDGSLVLNELKHAVQCENGWFMLPASKAVLCNSASSYVAPEVLNGLMEWRRSTPLFGEVVDSTYLHNKF